jgi:hypothetical protein
VESTDAAFETFEKLVELAWKAAVQPEHGSQDEAQGLASIGERTGQEIWRRHIHRSIRGAGNMDAVKRQKFQWVSTAVGNCEPRSGAGRVIHASTRYDSPPTDPGALTSTFGYGTAMNDAPPPLPIRDNPDKHRFEADLGDGSFAIAEYQLAPGRIIFIHTEVPPQHGGQGIGSALIRFALKSARERGLEVAPVCPFFAAYIRKHPEEQDLLAPVWREKLGLA